MTAVCLGVWYEAGSFQLHSGVTRGVRDSVKGGKAFKNRGTGWGQTTTGSKLILKVKLDSGEQANILIDQYFKGIIGKLTVKRLDLIKGSMPQFVDLNIHEKRDGSVYYTVVDADLTAWYNRIRPYL